MAFLEIKNVKIAGISACVPKEAEENLMSPVFSSRDEATEFIATTGIERRRISHNCIASDLCFNAAEKLLSDIGWDKSDIDALVIVTHCQDYLLPATSCILQDRLGLNHECFTLDIRMNGSGWVYGLSVAAGLLSTGMMKKALFLSGYSNSITVSEADKSALPFFGEAGAATAIEFQEGSPGFKFHFGTDGSEFETVIVPEGACRKMYDEHSDDIIEVAAGIKRSGMNIIIDHENLRRFGISKAPQTIKKLAEKYGLNLNATDYFILHQENNAINDAIRKAIDRPIEKFPCSLKNFGNTVAASIPLTFVTELSKDISNGKRSCIACGFGAGLSWGSVWFETDKNIVVSNLIEI
jgi:3-oxoacyl-[acyl-carrier-protein] synthase-3